VTIDGVEAPAISVLVGPSAETLDLGPVRATVVGDPIRAGRGRYDRQAFRPIASVTMRSVAFIVIALLLILVALPAVLGAAGP
jgi:hypothetical protein